MLHLAEQLKRVRDRVDCSVKVKTNKHLLFCQQRIADEVMHHTKKSLWEGEWFIFTQSNAGYWIQHKYSLNALCAKSESAVCAFTYFQDEILPSAWSPQIISLLPLAPDAYHLKILYCVPALCNPPDSAGPMGRTETVTATDGQDQ